MIQNAALQAFLAANRVFDMAELYTFTLLGQIGQSPNVIPDPSGLAFSWSINALLAYSPSGGAINGGKWVYNGTGAPSSFQVVQGQVFTVVPNTVYTLSAYIDATNVSAGNPFVAIEDPGLTTSYGIQTQAVATNGRVALTFTVPLGVTQVRCIFDTGNCTVANGQPLTFSNPQLELGSSASGYQPNTVIRLTTWDRDLTVGGNVFSSTGPRITRGTLKTAIGLDISDLEVDLSSDSTNLVGSVPILQAIQQGRFDHALLKLERLIMPTAGDTSLGTIVRFIGNVGPLSAGRLKAALTVNSAMQLLDTQLPRNLIQPSCKWTLFDSGCTLLKANFTSNSSANSGSGGIIVNTSLSQTTGYFDQGVITFINGANAGVSRTVRTFVSGVFTLNAPFPNPINVGDLLTAYPGCDKTKATCFSKFSNTANFKGEPFVPAPETAI